MCDLGDQWISPILVDTNSEEYTNEILSGFFPGANIQVRPNDGDIEILYYRPNGKVSKQVFNTQPIEIGNFMHAAEYSQNLIKTRPFIRV